jgi:hypothetical protein
MRGGLQDREGATGVGRDRMEGRQRGSSGSSKRGQTGLVGGLVGGGLGVLGGITNSVISPLNLVANARELFQDVSGVALKVTPAFNACY